MANIDHNLKRFVQLPFSFEAVVNDIAADDQRQGDLIRYVNYLLDDSNVPQTVSETFKPDNITNNASWDAIVLHCKLTFFKKGASDYPTRPLPDGYHENDFHRLDALRDDQYSAMRLQIKDDIVKELVRAYMEGGMAAAGANIRPDSIDKDARLAQLADEYRKSGCLNARVKQKLFAPTGTGPSVTFFMLVTDRDILIADYCVKSFSLLSGLEFRLVAFCNWVTLANRVKYFDKWRRNYSFVEVLEPAWMTEDHRPKGVSGYGYGLEGPYERCEVPWDRELPKFASRYCATVDADFEILHPAFMRAMIEQMDNSATAGFIGTDRTETGYLTYREDTGKNVLNSRINTWCCVYRREALSCDVSHLYYEEPLAGGAACNTWDSSGLKQLALKYIHGYQGMHIQPGFNAQWIHYGAFSKNKHLDEKNIEMWRHLMILRKVGYDKVLEPKMYSEYKARLQHLLRQMGGELTGSENVSQLASKAYYRMFRHVDDSNPHKTCDFMPIDPARNS